MDSNTNIDQVVEELQHQNLNDAAVAEVQENKPTQTDHVNKRLLDSFLERLNQNDNSVAFALNKNCDASPPEESEFSLEGKEGNGNACEKFNSQELNVAAKKDIPDNKPTLTDHINKKLLDSFLERLNQNDNSVAFALNSSSESS